MAFQFGKIIQQFVEICCVIFLTKYPLRGCDGHLPNRWILLLRFSNLFLSDCWRINTIILLVFFIPVMPIALHTAISPKQQSTSRQFGDPQLIFSLTVWIYTNWTRASLEKVDPMLWGCLIYIPEIYQTCVVDLSMWKPKPTRRCTCLKNSDPIVLHTETILKQQWPQMQIICAGHIREDNLRKSQFTFGRCPN